MNGEERVESEEIPSSYAEARLIHSIKMIDWIIKAFNNNFFFFVLLRTSLTLLSLIWSSRAMMLDGLITGRRERERLQ